MRTPKERTTTTALRQLQAAAEKRATAEELAKLNDPTGAFWERREADTLAQQGHAALTLTEPVRLGVGAEAILTKYPDEELHPSLWMQSTLDSPTSVAAQASYDRMKLALDLDVLTLALDLAETVQVRNSAEKLLCGQLAAAHQTAMQLLAKSLAVGQLTHPETRGDTVEACRLVNASARLMSVFQEGLLTLAKLRTGGKQTVVVQHQHVYVHDGGQAVVAGDLTTGGASAVGGGCENGGTMPCTEPSTPSGKPRAVGRTRGKGRRVKRQRAAADGVVGSTVGPTQAPHEATSTR
jgi:hypothetical protein